MLVLLAPLVDLLQRCSQFLSRCPLLYMRLPYQVFVPAEFEPKEVKPIFSRFSCPAANNFRLLRCYFQPELPKAFIQHPAAAFRVPFVLECAHKIVCIPDQARFSLTMSFHFFLKPQIECIVQLHVVTTFGDRSWE